MTHGQVGTILRFLQIVILLVLVYKVEVFAQPEDSFAAQLDIVASLNRAASGEWQVSGRVISNGESVANANVRVIATDDRGNRQSPLAVKTDSDGGFVIGPIDSVLGIDSNQIVSKIKITAIGSIIERDTAVVLQKTEILFISKISISVKVLDFFLGNPGWYFLLSGAIFIISILVAVFKWPLKAIYIKYVSSVSLALMLLLTMVIFLASAMHVINHEEPNDQLTHFGFVSIYEGRYVKDVQKEWLVSFTAQNKPENGSEQDIEKGFGAPLWVLLLSVIGAGLFTIILVIDAITGPKGLDEWKKLKKLEPQVEEAKQEAEWHKLNRQKIQVVVKHQFFVWFAPIGAIFIYQLLVISGTAYNQYTVALASLAAGVTPYWLLDKALGAIGNILKGSPERRKAN